MGAAVYVIDMGDLTSDTLTWLNGDDTRTIDETAATTNHCEIFFGKLLYNITMSLIYFSGTLGRLLSVTYMQNGFITTDEIFKEIDFGTKRDGGKMIARRYKIRRG